MPPFLDLVDDARIAARSLTDRLAGMRNPTLRLGVTGLSRSGKTVFITALVHALVRGSRLPVFRAYAEGRIRKASLSPQPDDAVPRFAYEDHLAALTGPDRHWPDSTRRIAELRLVIEYESRTGWFAGPRTLTLDIVDYPGEWLLDLALLDKDFATWSRDTVAASRSPAREGVSAEFLAALAGDRSRRAGRRGRRAARVRPVQDLACRGAGGAVLVFRAAAGALPDAGRSRRLARADLRAARPAGGLDDQAGHASPP